MKVRVAIYRPGPEPAPVRMIFEGAEGDLALNLDDGDAVIDWPWAEEERNPAAWLLTEAGEFVTRPADPAVAVGTLRTDRDLALGDTLWTVQADSPLTDDCKAEFAAWRVSLHRWLVDYPDGLTPLPPRPALAFRPLDQQ